jgi:hypothetical protein
MKTANRSLTLFNEPPINDMIPRQIRDWRHESSGIASDLIFRKFLNHHQYNIVNTTISIVVAKGLIILYYRESFAYNNLENECCLLPVFPQD